MSNESCEIPQVKLTDWDEIDRLKVEAGRIASDLAPRITTGDVFRWDELKDLTNQNLTLWKLLLRDLRSKGVKIGNNKDQFVRKSI